MTVVFEYAAALLDGSILQIVNVKLWQKSSCINTPPARRYAHFLMQVDDRQDKVGLFTNAFTRSGLALHFVGSSEFSKPTRFQSSWNYSDEALYEAGSTDN